MEEIEKNTKTRDSNIELLRIFCILLIIVHHIVVHAIKPQLEDVNLFPAGQMFNNFVFHKRLILLDFIACSGKMANNIFILISGYFLCEKVEFDLAKHLKKLLSQVIFASILLIIISTIYGGLASNPYTSLIGISVFNNEWVFIGYYACIIIIGRLFLNKILASLDQKKYTELLLALFAVVSLTFSRSVIYSVSAHLVIVVTGVFFYSLGGYIKKFDLFKNTKTIAIIGVIIMTAVLMIISYRNATLNEINSKLLRGEPEFHQSVKLYEEYSLASMVLAICIFEIFRRMKIPNSKVINSLASATFMVFLMHDNEFSRTIYRDIKWIVPYHDNLPQFLGMLILVMLGMYVFGVVAYVAYRMVYKIMLKINR